MKKFTFVALTAALVLGSLFVGGSFSKATASVPKILEFDTMVGNTLAFTGATNPIRGINGGGLPWMLTSASGELAADGKLEVEVTGLVLAAGANAGSNPIASFRGIVSCLTADGSPENVMTDPFPATTGPASSGGGNAKIEANLTLPETCIAPIVFVASPGGAWFAATGQ